ncbi:hypothetical protein ACIGEO_20430 [Stenotrophomonas bentonitica]|uniref:hypothetical protein n=1 Tax=Stenotrophomonas bentonitica TaxID=1450134 RepID=UPI0037D074D2
MRFIKSIVALITGGAMGSDKSNKMPVLASEDVEELKSKMAKLQSRVDALEVLPTQVDVIEGRLKKSFLPQLHFGFNLFSIMVVILLIAILASIVAVGMKWDFLRLMDLMAYLFPIGAGIFAGLGFYIRKPDLGSDEGKTLITEVNCFKTSVLFLFLGVISYLLSKAIAYDFVLSAFGFFGTGISLFSVHINSENMNRGPTRIDRRFRPIVLSIFAVNILASVTWGIILLSRFNWN